MRTQDWLTSGLLLFLLTPISAVSQTRRLGNNEIQHVVFIIKENRTFDNYFGRFPGAMGAIRGKISTGQSVPLWRSPDQTGTDLDHSYQGTLFGMDGGKMDRFDLIGEANINGQLLSYSQMREGDIPNYFAYARTFALADQMFSSMHGASFANHLYTVAAQSGMAIGIPTLNGKFIDAWGCDSDPNTIDLALNPDGAFSNVYPCFDFQTLADSVDNAGLTWKYYAGTPNSGGYVYSALDAINHIRNSGEWATNVVPTSQFIKDALAGNLPSVSWVTTTPPDTDHPPESVCDGENWTVKQINAIMQGPDWPSTAIFVAWDDYGGFYDHVKPPQIDQFGLGPRVPLVIISPYVMTGYISHTQYEFASVLKFIEEVFGLPALTSRDANANDTSDSFNFAQTPLPPLVLTPRTCPCLSASTVNFGNLLVGSSRNYQVKFVNHSEENLTISSVTTTGDFTTSNSCPSSLPPDKGCKINLTFTPTVAGSRTGTLTVTDNIHKVAPTSKLMGVGTFVNLPVFYPGLTFSGTENIGASAKKSVTVTNTGTSAITITKIQMVGDFSETDNCTPGLAAGANCNIIVTFAPTASGTRYGTLAIWDSDAGSPQTARLVGKGLQSVLSPKSLTFGSVAVGQSSTPQTVNIKNDGNSMLYVAGITTSGDFSQTNTCGAQVAPKKSCVITVIFSPTQKGTRKGILTINDSDFNSPQTVPMTGTGT